MKKKTSIYHRVFSFAYVLLIAVIFCGCGEPAKHKENIISAKRIDIHWFDENGYSSEEEFTVITIDSCEYLLAGYDRSRMITHKGNCKFCTERTKIIVTNRLHIDEDKDEDKDLETEKFNLKTE